MTEHFFSGRKPASIPELRIPGSSIKAPAGMPVNILDHYEVDYRAQDTSIRDVERFYFGDEIAKWSHGYDIGPQIDEDRWEQFSRWKTHSEIPQTIDVIPRAKEIGYKESSRERNIEGKYFHKSVVDLPINLVGKYVSKTESVRQALNNYLNTEEAQLLNKFMNSKGYSLNHDIEYFMSGGIPKNAIAAVHRKENFFAFNKNFRNMIARSAKAHNVDYDDEKFNTVLHELIHLYGIDSEQELENLALEFYLRIADREPNGYTNQNAKSIRSEKQKYLDKARIPLSRLASQGKAPSFKNIETVIEQLYTEAKEKGLDEQEAKEYIDACLEVYEKGGKTESTDSEKTEDIEASKEAVDEEATEIAEETAEADGEASE